MTRALLILGTTLILTLVLAAFLKDPLNAYFSQDDFFHFSLIWEKSFSSIPHLFLPGAESTQFYRPITRELYNLLMYKIFGLWALPYHLINLLLIILNGLIFLAILKEITKSKFILICTAFLYFFSAVHSIQLYYLSAIQTLISTLFALLSFYIFLNFKASGSKFLYGISICLFVLALLSHESSAVLPGIIIIYEFLNIKSIKFIKWKQLIVSIAPYALFVFIRLIINLTFLKMPDELVYKPVFSIGSLLNTFSWLTLWNFGLPEMLTDFATLTLNFNPNLFKFYSYYTDTVFPLFALIISSLILITLGMLRSNLRDKHVWFLGLGYITTLTPFLFFPNHKFVYYLTLPVLFFSGFCGILLGKYWYLGKSHKFLIICFILGYIVISYQTISLNKITHWAAKRAASANFLVSDIRKRFTNPEKASVFYIKNDPKYPFIAKEWGTSSKQAFYILSGSDAFRLIFSDPSINTFYEDITGPPKEKDIKNLLIYEAAFPY